MEIVESAGLLPTSARSLTPLRLYQPKTVSDALIALAQSHHPVLLAGGSDLVAQYNEGVTPTELVDISGLDDLKNITLEGSTLRIGALVTHYLGSTHELVEKTIPGFANAWTRIANPRIRFRATIGGNLMSRRTRYEGSILLGALRAKANVASVSGSRQIDVKKIWDGEVDSKSLLTSIDIDTESLIAFDYERSLRPLMTQAVSLWKSGAGTSITLSIATEYIRPVIVTMDLPATLPAELAANAKTIAKDLLAKLPASFADAVVTNAYARNAGAAFLSRQLEKLHV